MGTTPTYGFPYPDPSSPPDMGYWGQQLAEAVEDLLAARLAVPQLARCSAQLTLTASNQDVAGATLTVTTTRPAQPVMLTASVASRVNTGAGPVVTEIQMDGVTQTGQIVSAGARDMGSGQWLLAPAAAGAHVFKLRALISAGTGVVDATHTVLTAEVH